MFTDEAYGYLKLVADGGELTRIINQKEKSDLLQAYRCPLCDRCYSGECSSISKWNIVNHLVGMPFLVPRFFL